MPHHLAINGAPPLLVPQHPLIAIYVSRRRGRVLTRLQQSHSSAPADGMTELSCWSRESIYWGIMIMDHPLAMRAAHFAAQMPGVAMGSRKGVREHGGELHDLPGPVPFGYASGSGRRLPLLQHPRSSEPYQSKSHCFMLKDNCYTGDLTATPKGFGNSRRALAFGRDLPSPTSDSGQKKWKMSIC